MMLLFNFLKLKAWYDDGSGIAWSQQLSGEKKEALRIVGNSFFIKNCQFHKIEATGENGAIFINRNSFLLVDSASFDFCFSIFGGIIYKEGGGESALKNMCVYKCRADECTACYISVGTGISNRNSMESTSIVHSLEPSDSGPTDMETVYFENGNILLEHNNISENHLNSVSFGILRSDGDPSIKSKISFTSIVGNTASTTICLRLDETSSLGHASFDIYSCNILKNDAVDDRFGLFRIECSVVMRNTSILGNGDKKMNYYFGSTGSCKLIGCIIDNDMCNTKSKLLIEEEAKTSFINRLEMVSTADCISALDSYGNITNEEEITYEKTKNICFNRNLARIVRIFI